MMWHLETALTCIGNFLWGWPLIIFFMASAVIITGAFRGIQVRYWAAAWRLTLFPDTSERGVDYMSPFQAFLNTLSASLGNGSMAGMATALAMGGPGAAFWIFVLGFFTMAVRFAEVFASTLYTQQSSLNIIRGGPMVFLQRVPGGAVLPTLYALFCLLTSFIAGCAMQCNSMSVGMTRITGISTQAVAVILGLFVLYSMMGGAARIIAISEYVIPIKVGLFFTATIIVLLYHAAKIPEALMIIMQSAFTSDALSGAAVGHTVQQALRYGLSRSLSATEAGLGTAGILFGSTASVRPLATSIMSMISIFVSNHLVCCSLMLIFVASGAWQSGLTSVALTCVAYETVFGSFGGCLVTFLSISFGLGVLVAYAFIGRECWIFLTKGRWIWLYNSLFCCMALIGSVARVAVVWNAVDIANAGMLIMNMYGILMLLPRLMKQLKILEQTAV